MSLLVFNCMKKKYSGQCGKKNRFPDIRSSEIGAIYTLSVYLYQIDRC